AGAAGQIAVGLRRVGGGLLVAHADIGNAFLLRGRSNRGDRKPDDPEQVVNALLFEAPRNQGSAVDFAHAFLLVTNWLQPRDYALMEGQRKGFAGNGCYAPSNTIQQGAREHAICPKNWAHGGPAPADAQKQARISSPAT